MISAQKFWDNQPSTSLALFNIHEIIEPIIPGSDANALSANLPNSCDRALNLLFIHSLAPPFLSPPLVPPDVRVDMLGPPNRASIRTPIVLPRAVKIEMIVIPCSLKRVLILSPSVPISLSKNFMIDSLIWYIWLEYWSFKMSIWSFIAFCSSWT